MESYHHKKELKDYFSKQTRYWKFVYNDQQKKITSFRKIEMRKRKTSVLKALDAAARNKHLKVLDIGCGPGGFVKSVLKRGHNLIGSDISLDMVIECKQSSGKFLHGGIPVLQADIENLPFSNGSFDVVLCIGVLQYLKKDDTALGEISRVIRPDGIAIVTTPNILKLSNLLDPYFYIWRVPQYARLKFSRVFRKDSKSSLAIDFKKNTDFSNRRYFLKLFKPKCKHYNLFNVSTYSIGFGPFTFWKKEIFSIDWSLRIDRFFERISKKSLFTNINYFASRWVLCFQKRNCK